MRWRTGEGIYMEIEKGRRRTRERESKRRLR